MAPLPVAGVALEKILFGAIQSIVAALVVFPVVYISEGLRGVLTPDVPHMHPAVFLGAMVLLLAFLSMTAMRLFLRRVMT
jgi:ABC-2 type transport system permease protein